MPLRHELRPEGPIPQGDDRCSSDQRGRSFRAIALATASIVARMTAAVLASTAAGWVAAACAAESSFIAESNDVDISARAPAASALQSAVS